ncbi:hypothetical protein LCGC14_0484160 [marine sediment metagenome]|uniref:DUF2171 domain-containing protein n=1 Tax=marine sediment metagenome TaxID=412755 RepID=A0A0F9UVI3_9ZZZZ|nr:DUF2171 domain-containing protein [Methylophaga sp.]HEC58172.1 DUF2171 domain-containing protein [Methylophaga sp.]
MTNVSEIKPEMPVVCSEDGQFGVVDHMEGSNYIKLKKDTSGQHHFIPMDWVVSTDNGKVKIDRPGGEAMNEWMTESDLD